MRQADVDRIYGLTIGYRRGQSNVGIPFRRKTRQASSLGDSASRQLLVFQETTARGLGIPPEKHPAVKSEGRSL